MVLSFVKWFAWSVVGVSLCEHASYTGGECPQIYFGYNLLLGTRFEVIE
jgi:hypothetical protein